VTDGDGSTRWRPDRNAAQMHLELLGDAAVGVRAESSAPVESERGAPADNHCCGDYTRYALGLSPLRFAPQLGHVPRSTSAVSSLPPQLGQVSISATTA
jgi:hypothetical protein